MAQVAHVAGFSKGEVVVKASLTGPVANSFLATKVLSVVFRVVLPVVICGAVLISKLVVTLELLLVGDLLSLGFQHMLWFTLEVI